MKKSKLSLGLISCLLSVGALAGCDTLKSSSDGVLLRYKIDGVEQEPIKADDILKDYYNDSSKYQAIYDTIYSVIARNYFSKERKSPTDPRYSSKELGLKQMDDINREAKEKVSDDLDTAQSNADANNTRYKKELEAIFESKGVKDKDELFDKYVEELQKETFENNFYTYFIEDIKNGDKEFKMSGETDPFWAGYLNDQLPYHVSHILVKLADSSDTNYYNGTISEENALRLNNVLTQLSEGKKKFAKIAHDYSEDPGSKTKEGDLGVMDADTSFINEFKLGIYAYEQLYSLNKDNVPATSNITISDKAKDTYNERVNEMFGITSGIPTVRYSLFAELAEYAEAEKDENKKQVMDGNSLVFPRNVLYNKYLNRHAVFFIEDETEHGNFVNTLGKNLLCADGDPTKPIVAVRGSSGGEQEIHLMVVNRSPFAGTGEDKVVNGVSLSDYYTSFYPAQEQYYPMNGNKQADTYVNFLSNDVSETKTRAEELASKFKSFNSDKLGKYIFLKYMEEEEIEFAKENEDLEKALMKWIKTSIQKSAEEKKEAYTKTWNEYLDKLSRQNSERAKRIPEVAKYCFKYGNIEDKTLESCKSFDAFEDYEKADLCELLISVEGCDTNDDGEISSDEAKAFWTSASSTIKTAYKEEGGLFNDGKKHQ